MPPPRTRSGVALIMVVGTLGVLSALGSSFCILGRIERRAALQRVHGTKALLLARSGVEDALARLDLGQDPAYGGEDWNGNGLLDFGVERDHELHNRWRLDTEACPVRHALRPSFFSKEGILPALQRISGRLRGRSGRLSGDLQPMGNTWALKQLPGEGIYVNGGDLSSAGEHVGTYDTVLKHILGNLAEGIPGLARADGEALVTLRPAGGWTSMEQIRFAMGWTNPWLRAKADLLTPYLAFHAWVDKKVIRPNLVPTNPAAFPPYPTFVNKQTHSWASVRTGFCDAPPTLWAGSCRKPNAYTRSWAPDFERDSMGVVVGRAPVSLAWARNKPVVLRALLKELAGVWMHSGSLIPVPVVLDSTDVNKVVSALGALGPATTYSAYPGWDGSWTIDSWEEFNHFVDEKVALPASSTQFGTIPAGRKNDLIKSAFNPNSNLNSVQPNATLCRWIAKSDLTVYSTELSLEPPLGFQLSAEGRLTDIGGRLLGRHVLSVRVDRRRLRLTTQSEFCAGDGGLGDPEVAGDEGLFRMPGDTGFISASRGLASETTFASRTLLNHGQALQTYPEPQWPTGGCPSPAVYDGSLQLATLESQAGEPGMTFLASWTGGLDADFAVGSPSLVLDHPADLHRPMGGSLSLFGTTAPPQSIPWTPPGGGAVRLYPELRSRVTSLHPDGFHCDPRRVPCYLAAGNLPCFTPTISFWVKGGPCFEKAMGKTPHTLFDGLRIVQTGIDPLPPRNPIFSTQALYVAHSSWDDVSSLGARSALGANWSTLGETGLFVEDWGKSAPDPLGPHLWHQVTCQWDLRASSPGALVELTVDGEATPSVSYNKPLALPASSVQDLSGPAWLQVRDGSGLIYEGVQPHRIFFGAHRIHSGTLRDRGDDGGTQFSDHLLDEFAIYDLGSDLNAGRDLARARHASGRYYKGDDGRWTSGEIRLPSGSRVNRVDWTLILPSWDPAQAAHPNRVFFGTGSDPAAGDSADVVVEVLEPAGGASRWASTCPGGPGLLLPDGRLRLSATLRPRLADNVDESGNPTLLDLPLADSPVLDDLTVTWTPPGGLLGWQSGE